MLCSIELNYMVTKRLEGGYFSQGLPSSLEQDMYCPLHTEKLLLGY